MKRRDPFKRHRFPLEIILLAVRWYCRYPLSYQDVVDLLAERGVALDRSVVFRWVQKFGPEIAKRTERHLRRSSLNWHVDETYIRVGIMHIDKKWRNNRIESDHAVLKRLLGYRQTSDHYELQRQRCKELRSLEHSKTNTSTALTLAFRER